MEKASKKIADVEIEMNEGSMKNLLTLTDKDFPNLKLDDDGGLNLKRGVVKDDGQMYVERRLFKRSNNVKIVLGDLSLPLTKEALDKLGFEEVHSNYIKGKRISWDAEQIGGSGLNSEDKQFMALRKKVNADVKLTLDEKKFMAGYLKKLQAM
jgi:hypothetical protein